MKQNVCHIVRQIELIFFHAVCINFVQNQLHEDIFFQVELTVYLKMYHDLLDFCIFQDC